MKFHYAGNSADWDVVALADRTRLQRLAARSHGFLTLSNIITTLGLGLVIFGLFVMTSGDLWTGIGYLFLGRLADILDGTVAERTGTKGPVGEALDAGFDKLAAVAVLACFVYHDWLPVIPVVCVALQVLGSSVMGFTARVRHVRLHVSATGKITAVFTWAILFLFAAASALRYADHHTAYVSLAVIGYALTLIYVYLGIMTTGGYFKDATKGLDRPLYAAIVAGATSLRILCAALIIWAAVSHHWLPLLPLALVAFASDFFDGWLARRWKVVSTFGMAFDPLADKVVCLVLLAIAAVYVQDWYWALFTIFAVYDVFTMTTRFISPRPMPASKVAKLKTALLMVGLICMILGMYATVLAWLAALLLTAAAVLTVRSFITYVRALGRSLTWLEYPQGVSSIDFASWHKEHGIRAVLFDIDGTVAPWNDARVDEAVKLALQHARTTGITHIGLVSNMSHRRTERLMAVVEQTGASTYHVPHNRHERKPSPAMIHAAFRAIDASPGETGFVGDKLIDVVAARRAGVARVAWVERLGVADHPLDRILYRPVERIIKWLIR
jgi:HAD superfamily phosphatase (TIGR01668 family)